MRRRPNHGEGSIPHRGMPPQASLVASYAHLMAVSLDAARQVARDAVTGTARHVSRPEFFLGMIEPQRAMVEAAGLITHLPKLVVSPRPDGHPVLVIPGLSGGTNWCRVLRGYLTLAGHNVHQPRAGATKGRLKTVVRRLAEHVEELQAQSGQSVSVIGWSVGGVTARQVGIAAAGATRRVITLGAPASGFWYAEIPGTSGLSMPVPTTSIYSKSDPWFDWRTCAQPAGRFCEDVIIPSSHLGMATNPFAYTVILDRLAQDAGTWHRYRPGPFSPIQSKLSNAREMAA